MRGCFRAGPALYFSPDVGLTADGGYSTSGLVGRYDTTVPFDAGSSWSAFDVTSLSATASGFFGGAYDGRYVYVVPAERTLTASSPQGNVVRYDTQAPFD